TEGAFRHFLHDVVAADGFDDIFFSFLTVVVVIIVIGGMLFASRRGGMFAVRWLRLVGTGVIERVLGGGMDCVFVRTLVVMVRGRRLRCRRSVRLEARWSRHVRLERSRVGVGRAMLTTVRIVCMIIVVILLMTFMVMMIMVMMIMVMMDRVGLMIFGIVAVDMVVVAEFVVPGLCGLRLEKRALDDLAPHAIAAAAAARIAMPRAAAAGTVFGFLFGLAMGALVGFDQSLAVGDRDLIIVGMDFAEGQKSVAVATVFDKGRLQRRFYARDLGEVDVAAQLLALGGFKIKFFDAIAAHHNDPGLFRVGSIDQHFVGHFGTHDGGGGVSPWERVGPPGDPRESDRDT